MKKTKILIVGSGPAGYTAAIYAGRGALEPVLISGALPGGLLTQTTLVENFPGFPDGVMGSDLMMAMMTQADKCGCHIEYDEVGIIEYGVGAAGEHRITLSGGEVYETEALIIATGASPRWLDVPGEDRLKNHGVSACATCDGAFFKDKKVVVVGGGDSAMEEAIYLTNFASLVTVIHRRDELRASKVMADRALHHDKISFIWNSVVTEVVGDKQVEGVKVRNVVDNQETLVACEGFFAALGHVPNTGLFAQAGLPVDDQGFLIVDGATSVTAISGVFAAGDCADRRYRQAITAAGAGCRAAMDAERFLALKESQ